MTNAVVRAHERIMCSQGALRSDPSPAETKCRVVRCDLAARALESRPKPKQWRSVTQRHVRCTLLPHSVAAQPGPSMISISHGRWAIQMGHMGHMEGRKAAMT